MPKSKPRIPSYRHYKPKDLGVVRLNGKDIYLGKYDTPESRGEYDRLIAEWLLQGRSTPVHSGKNDAAGLSVNQILLAYIKHAQTYYVRDGEPT